MLKINCNKPEPIQVKDLKPGTIFTAWGSVWMRVQPIYTASVSTSLSGGDGFVHLQNGTFYALEAFNTITSDAQGTLTIYDKSELTLK